MDALPPNALLYLPVLRAEVAQFWPGLATPSVLGAQVEQETCVSLKSRGCWNPHTELKTDREYGFGLGQITITSRFNVFNEVKALDPSLRAWAWADRYNPQLQLRALLLKDKQTYDYVTGARTPIDRLAFTFAGYNGGMGGVSSDRRLCQATPGCDSGVWFNNVERTSLKAKSVASGYGQSFFQINRGYVVNILRTRRGKYVTPPEVYP